MGSQPFPLDNWMSKYNTDINKHLKTYTSSLHSLRPHNITKVKKNEWQHTNMNRRMAGQWMLLDNWLPAMKVTSVG